MSQTIKEIRITHVTTVPETLQFLTGQISFLRSCGCDVSVVSSPGFLLDKLANAEGWAAAAVPMQRRITPLRDLVAIYRLWRHFRKKRPHVVHAHTPKGGLLGMIAAWLAWTPVRIYHIRGLPLMTATGLRRHLLTWSEWISCRLAHRVLTVSRSMREVALAEEICPPEKIVAFLNGSGNGVDAISRFNPARLESGVRDQVRARHKIPEDALVVGYIGRIVRDKGIAELVEAWRRLRSRFPQVYLLVVGYFERQDPVARDVEHVLRTDPRIRLAGTHWDTSPFYAGMDLVVLPTYREGFPNVPLEAAAMERPVVATRIPGCIDAVQDGVTGLLVAPRDAEALADAIAQYVDDPALRTRHGSAGRLRVLRDFRPEDIWREVGREYLQQLRIAGVSVPEYTNALVDPPKKAA